MSDSYIRSRHPKTTAHGGAEICRRCTMERLELVPWPCPAVKELEDTKTEGSREALESLAVWMKETTLTDRLGDPQIYYDGMYDGALTVHREILRRIADTTKTKDGS